MRIIALDSSACHLAKPSSSGRSRSGRGAVGRTASLWATGRETLRGRAGEASRAHDASGEGPPREHLVLWQAQARQHLAHGEEDLGNHSKEELVS